jgi:hypothetical protein
MAAFGMAVFEVTVETVAVEIARAAASMQPVTLPEPGL